MSITSFVINEMNINRFLAECEGNGFVYIGKITRDNSSRASHVKFNPEPGIKINKTNSVYILTKNGTIQKIGGTKNGWNERWSSYLCGRHSLARGGSGKCSVTNQEVYDWLDTNVDTVDIGVYVWEIPAAKITRRILGEDVEIIATIFEAYETKLIELYKSLNNGDQPFLNKNSDPTHR
jgi:hypothetical protein